MKDGPWILIDASYLAWRAHHSTGNLSHRDVPTGVTYGFLREVLTLRHRFRPRSFAFCFDSPRLKRCEFFPGYKSRRRETTEEQDEARASVFEQLRALRKEWLPSLGFANVLQRDGYEADDLIAGCVDGLKGANVVIVSADRDLFQLIDGDEVTVWNSTTKVLLNEKDFVARHGIGPGEWSRVKAIAGCDGDCVPGVKGVGERTAIKYLNGDLKESSSTFKKIESSRNLIDRNRKLVDLPWPGLGDLKLLPDETSTSGWERACRELGFKSLRQMVKS